MKHPNAARFQLTHNRRADAFASGQESDVGPGKRSTFNATRQSKEFAHTGLDCLLLTYMNPAELCLLDAER